MTSQFYVEILEVNVFKISLSCKLNVIKKNRVDTTSNKKKTVLRRNIVYIVCVIYKD